MIEKNIHQSRTFKITLLSGGALIALLAAFTLGVYVGFHKASFSYRVGEHYDALFNKNDKAMMPPPFDTDDIPGGHEAAGKIISVELPVFVVVGPDNIEKKVEVATDTVITALRSATSSQAIKIGEDAVIIGAPGADSDIVAGFIRILPVPLPAIK